jgi:hypothetical protein
MPAQSALEAVQNLRNPDNFQWYVIPLFAFVVYVYAVEVERKNWNLIFAGLAFWGMDWFNELANSLVFHFTQFAPIWGAPGKSAYEILIGLNIEISFMFAIAGITFAKMLPEDKNMKILGLNNRWFFALVNSIFCVIVELFLNAAGALTWEYSWWNAGAPFLIVIFGYLTFFIVSYWVFDMKTIKKKLTALAVIYGVDLALILIFGVLLKWL